MTLLSRVGGAPITWGVDGSPGWGHLMDRERVLSEMRQVGLSATELGPEGYLPGDAGELRALLDRFGLALIGGFVPAVLYRPELVSESLANIDRAAATLAGTGASVMVLAPDSLHPGYDRQIDLTEAEWDTLLTSLDRAAQIASGHGLRTVLHPHWGMAVVGQDHVERVLDRSRVDLCIDTGHLALAGADPVAVAKAAAGRVAHVHLKDLDEDLARQVRSGALAFRQAVIDGLFLPLGDGSVDIRGLVETLEAQGYGGWYVIEQDVVLEAEPESGEGPIRAAARSFAFLEDLAGGLRVPRGSSPGCHREDAHRLVGEMPCSGEDRLEPDIEGRSG
ncbi:MAG: TIM barrel protein [Actinobacteria bacterium]|nr:TIM barrel protein [Actinomycetota bacterium]